MLLLLRARELTPFESSVVAIFSTDTSVPRTRPGASTTYAGS